MGGCRCSYKNCIRATKNSEKDFHFFHYPVRDPDRCSKWIANAKKPSFHELPEDQLRNKVVCQLHFESQYFTNANKKRLIHNAIPTLDAGSEETKAQEINVQVLQSDSDGNVFTVDTDDLMQSEVRDVESYVIRNGNIIPADLSAENEVVKPPEPKKKAHRPMPCAVKSEDEVPFKEFLNNGVSVPACDHTEPPISAVPLKIEPWLDQPNKHTSPDVIETTTKESPSTQQFMEVLITAPTQTECNNQIEATTINQECVGPDVVTMSKTIQRHSKEIASIKRFLNQKIRKSKRKKHLTNQQIINKLSGLIPPTLCGAVSLHLFKRESNFTRDEESFLATVYKGSPIAYDIFLKDFKWKLPRLDTVKKVYLKRNCIR